MAINEISVNSSGGADWDKPTDNFQKEQLEKFESIFNRLDENHDGTISGDDNLTEKDRNLANFIHQSFNIVQNKFGTALEFTIHGIKSLLNMAKGTKDENSVRTLLIESAIAADEQLEESKEESKKTVLTKKNGETIEVKEGFLPLSLNEELGIPKGIRLFAKGGRLFNAGNGQEIKQ